MRRSEPLRVLQIIGISAGGGVESVIMNYYRHIDRSRVQFDFVIHADSPVDITAEVEALGGRVYKVPPYTQLPAFIREVRRIIREGGYRIVHSNMNALSAFPLFAARLAGAPIRILHNHSTDTKAEPLRTVLKHILRPFAKYFATERWACSRLAGEWMYGAAAMRRGEVTIINNAIDIRRFAFDPVAREEIREELGLEHHFVIGHAGRFMKQKNHDFILDVFAELLKKKEDACLLLIGDGPLRGETEAKAVRLGIADKVIFTGVRNDVNALYNAMDVFLFPSLYEGLGMVAVEAQVNGLPVIASEEVPQEAKLGESMQRLPLAKGAVYWAEKVLACSGMPRHACDAAGSGFDIEKEAPKLADRYEQLAERERM